MSSTQKALIDVMNDIQPDLFSNTFTEEQMHRIQNQYEIFFKELNEEFNKSLSDQSKYITTSLESLDELTLEEYLKSLSNPGSLNILRINQPNLRINQVFLETYKIQKNLAHTILNKYLEFNREASYVGFELNPLKLISHDNMRNLYLMITGEISIKKKSTHDIIKEGMVTISLPIETFY